MERIGTHFKLPEEWLPQLKVPYNSPDKRFDVWVSYEGIQESNSAPMHKWLVALVLRGNIILDAQPFWWDPSDRDLSNEDVARRMIDAWKHADFNKLLDEITANPYEFEPKIRAVALIDQLFYRKTDVDFDIIWHVNIGESWKMLMCTDVDDNYYEVIHDALTGKTQVHGYSMVDNLDLLEEEVTKIIVGEDNPL